MLNPFDDLIPGDKNPYAITQPPTQGQVLDNQGQVLTNTRTQQQIGDHPLERQNTQTSVQQKQQDISFAPPKQAKELIESFRSDPIVKGYRESLPVIIGATQAQPGGAGDLSVVYGWAKAMDPNSVVREGEVGMAQTAAGPMQRAQFLVSQYRLSEGGSLPPDVRRNLIEEMRTKGRQLNLAYSEVYKQYRDLLERSGLPSDLLGPHEGDKFAAAEEQYVRSINQDGVGPSDPNYRAYKGEGVPQAPGQTVEGFDLRKPAGPPPMAEEFRSGLYTAMRSGQIKSPNDMKAWVAQFNKANNSRFNALSNKETMLAIQAARQGKPFNVELPEYAPDISDARGQGGLMEDVDAGIRGAADTVSFGLADKLAAAGNTLFGGGTMDENLAREYAISDYDSENNPLARFGGQAVGGFGVPFGAINSLPQFMAKGAAYGGAYGLGTSRDWQDVPGNVAMGGAAGAAVPLGLQGLSSGFRGAKNFVRGRPTQGDVPPLVNPQTLELNQPMDAMSPAQRMKEFQELGLKTVTPGMAGGRSARVVEQGFNNLPGSAGIMEDVNAAAAGELRQAANAVASKFGSSRTLNEGGAELQRGAQSWMGRAAQLDRKVYDAIPIADDAPAALNTTRSTLGELTSQFGSNPQLAEALKSAKLGQYADALQSGQLSWKDLKAFRSRIGYEIGEMRLGGDSPTKDQLRALYGALSEDMRNTAAAMGPRAIHAFERANTFHRQMEARIEEGLTRILGPDIKASPEKAALAVQAMAQGGKSTADLKTLAQVRASTIKSGAWDEIAATLIRLGGQPTKSSGREFQPATFVNWYADMAEPARAMLFKPELRKSLDQFVAANQQLQRVKGLANTSNTAPVVFGGSALLTAGAAITNPILGAKLAATLGGNYAMGKLWTHAPFVRWATGFTKAYASGNPNAVKSQVGRLQKLAVANPELRGGVEQLLRSFANDNASRSGRLAASPDERPEDDEDPYR